MEKSKNNTRNDDCQEINSVPYVVYRDMESSNRRIVLFLVAIILIEFVLAVFALYWNNHEWLETWNQYDLSTEAVTTTVDSEGDGIANYSGGDGGVNIYGEGYSSQENCDTKEADRSQRNQSSQEEVTNEPGN